MIDIALLAGRILLIALLFLFLFAVMRTGIGLVRGQNKSGNMWTITVQHGPRELRGVKIAVNGPVIVGRSPGADIVIVASYVSGRHARFSRLGENLIIEDLGSTNGTTVNGTLIHGAEQLEDGDVVGIGDVTMRVSFR
ncbi:MAG: FHA domain-containing protein [Coriobacteriales bacterium]|nr:FHA domain-containing protein [Coriobacteriales bacterium]